MTTRDLVEVLLMLDDTGSVPDVPVRFQVADEVHELVGVARTSTDVRLIALRDGLATHSMR